MTPDYRKYYDLEKYLFTEVGPRFAKTGDICPADFYMIIIWKANRAKTRVRDRLNKQPGGFAATVKSMAASLHASAGPMRRLEVLMKEWGFLLPMASAILTVLYPTDFSVYDIRVCEQLGDFKKLAHRRFSDGLWNDYQEFLNAVKAAAPKRLSLRDKDRYIWGVRFMRASRKTCEADRSLPRRHHSTKSIGGLLCQNLTTRQAGALSPTCWPYSGRSFSPTSPAS